jgi:hypothetical protein
LNGKLRELTTSLVLKVSWDSICVWVKSSDFSDYSNLLRAEFQQPGRLQNCITPKPFIESKRANNRWKDKKVLYNSCIWLWARFPSVRSQLCTYRTAAHSQVRYSVGAEILILKFSWRIRGCPHIMVFPRHDVVFILCPRLLFSQDGSQLVVYIFEA